MEELKNQIDIRKLRASRLVVGEEYLLYNRKCLAVFLGRPGGAYIFIETFAIRGYASETNPFGKSDWGSVEIDGVIMQSWMSTLYPKYKDLISNLKRVKYIYSGRQVIDEAIHISNTPLTQQQLQKPIMSEGFAKVIEAIKKESSRTSVDYKIASLMLSKLPEDFCQINETGLMIAAGNKKEAVVFTLNREKAIKALRKFERMNLAERQKINSNISSLVINNLEPTKIGRIVKRVAGELFPDNQIESFVNAFSARVIDMTVYKVELVKGKDISKWYNYKNYTTNGKGTLHNSCMRGSENSPQWQFYVHHPKCEMLIVTLGGMLNGRALVWTLADGSKYMDRIYYTSEVERKMMVKWAEDNGIDKTYEKYATSNRGFSKTMLVEACFDDIIKASDTAAFPYADTFQSFTCDLKYLIRVKNSFEREPDKWTDADLYFVKTQCFGNSRNVAVKNQIAELRRARGKGYMRVLEEGQVHAVDTKEGIWVVVDEKDAKLEPANRRYIYEGKKIESKDKKPEKETAPTF